MASMGFNDSDNININNNDTDNDDDDDEQIFVQVNQVTAVVFLRTREKPFKVACTCYAPAKYRPSSVV